MNANDEILVYRARFEVSVDPCAASPSRPVIAPIDMVLAKVWDWLTAGGRLARQPALARLAEGPLALRTFRADGLRLKPEGPRGAALATEQYAGDGFEYWAMDYDEPVPHAEQQRERTTVGLAKAPDGTCVVNIRVARHLLPEVFVKGEVRVRRMAPLYARRMLERPGYRLSSGSMELERGARWLTAEGFDAAFARGGGRGR